jgi:hypothetical protein
MVCVVRFVPRVHAARRPRDSLRWIWPQVAIANIYGIAAFLAIGPVYSITFVIRPIIASARGCESSTLLGGGAVQQNVMKSAAHQCCHEGG